MIDFVPPHNKEFEEMILGSILYEPTLIQKCVLNPEDFYYGNHQQIYQIFLNLQEKKIPIDLVTLGEALASDPLASEKILEANGYLSNIVNTANFSHYESQVKEFSLRRQVVKVLMGGLRHIGEATSDETISGIRQAFAQILSGRAAAELSTMKDVVKEIVSFVERRYSTVGVLSGIPSGLKNLDDMTDGFQGSDFIIIAGRPGAGKSALAMHIAEHAASTGTSAGVLHLEMGKHQVGIRTLASFAKVEMWKLRKGKLSESDWSPLVAAAARAADLPIWFSFSAMESRAISKVITAMVEEHGCKIIILDYLQLAQDKNAQKREREVANISALLKATSKIYNIPVIGVAQLNRDVEREKRKPRLSDLRESGAIEQDADVVLFLHKEEEETNRLEIIVGKGRNIGIGSCFVAWNRAKMIFGDYTERKES